MITYTLRQSHISPLFVGLLFLTTCIIIGGIVLMNPSAVDTETISHAIEKHATNAVEARQIIADCNPGALQEYTNDGKILFCVKLPNGRTAIQICNGKGCEITAFISRSAHYLSNFLSRGGYEPIR